MLFVFAGIFPETHHPRLAQQVIYQSFRPYLHYIVTVLICYKVVAAQEFLHRSTTRFFYRQKMQKCFRVAGKVSQIQSCTVRCCVFRQDISFQNDLCCIIMA